MSAKGKAVNAASGLGERLGPNIDAQIQQKKQHIQERTDDALTDAEVQAEMAGDLATAIVEDAVGEPARGWIDDNVENDWVASQASDSVTQLVVVGATLIVGVIVYSKIESSTPAPENSDLNNSSKSVTDTVASSFELGSVLPIVLVAGAILFYLRGFGGMGGGGGRR
jgi:hypothetical protein